MTTAKPTHAYPSDQAASGRSLGNEELSLLAEVLEQGVLTSTKGCFVRQLEEEFAALLGVPHVVACSSGSSMLGRRGPAWPIRSPSPC